MKISNPIERHKLTVKYLGWNSKGYVVETRGGKKGLVLIVNIGSSTNPRYTAYKTLKDDVYSKLSDVRIEIFKKEIEKWFKISGYNYILSAKNIEYSDGKRRIPIIRMPFCEMDLRMFIKKRGKLDQIETIIFTLQILKGLIFAKNNGINSHQDLKPENILIRYIEEKFVDFPPEQVHESICYNIKISDFGMANAWEEAGMPQGSFPYMAPEQYLPDKYEEYKPDIFSLGVMIIEMLTGNHPYGKKTSILLREWKSPKLWESWSFDKNKHRIIDTLDIDESLRTIITKMISINPSDRPDEYDLLTDLFKIFYDIDEYTAKQLKLLFDYFDELSEKDRFSNQISAYEHLSDIPSNINSLIVNIEKDIAELKNRTKTQRETVFLCNLCRIEAESLLKRNRASDKKRAEYYGELIINEIIEIRNNISCLEIYPNHILKDFKLVKEPYTERDFEEYSFVISWGAEILNRSIGLKRTKEYFKNKDKITLSAFCIFNARKYFFSNPIKAAKMLDNCINLNPKEAFIYYLKARWLIQYLFYLDPDDKERQNIINIIKKNLDKAIEIDPDWLPPKNDRRIFD